MNIYLTCNIPLLLGEGNSFKDSCSLSTYILWGPITIPYKLKLKCKAGHTSYHVSIILTVFSSSYFLSNTGEQVKRDVGKLSKSNTFVLFHNNFELGNQECDINSFVAMSPSKQSTLDSKKLGIPSFLAVVIEMGSL
jgi:hypothetical protein